MHPFLGLFKGCYPFTKNLLRKNMLKVGRRPDAAFFRPDEGFLKPGAPFLRPAGLLKLRPEACALKGILL